MTETADLPVHVGYLRPTKAALKSAMQAVFGADFPIERYRRLLVSLEFPATEEAYPSIWVDYTPGATLETAGIGHYETYVGEDDLTYRVQRWRFSGQALFTIVSLEALQRDEIYDYVMSEVAFGPQAGAMTSFRSRIEENDLVALQPNWDKVETRGFAASPGTPWDTTEMIYEGTVVLDLTGEFARVVDTGELAHLTAIQFTAARETLPAEDSPPGGGWR